MICPKCGDALSSATKVCPRCGYVVDDKMDEYLNDLESSLVAIKALPKESFGAYFSSQAYIMYAIAALVFLIVFFMTDGGLFLILAAVFLILTAVYLIRKFAGARRHRDSEESFRTNMVAIESMMRQLKNDYGESKEVRDRIRSTSSELKDIVHEHNANHRHAVKVWIAVIAVVLAVSVAGIVMLGSRDLDGNGDKVESTL